ncbi:MAG: nucleotidyltransferase domain-containing protein [Nitriliruptor sp.]|nr:MAG: nucleotidyltransferase domain-containing protein [Nitriliruptor sp.]
MHDPREGITPDGMIRTGVTRGAIAPVYTPVLQAAVATVPGPVSLYVYGSVATGTATPPTSDVDLLSIGLPASEAERLSIELSERFRCRCRDVSVGPASWGDLEDQSDEGYGLRVFLRHYCVHLAGADPSDGLPEYPADARAARGFNGDIAQHLQRWRSALPRDTEVARLGTRIARKTLLAVAALVSLRDATWSTDRRACAARWNELEPAIWVDTLVAWLDAPPGDRDAITPVLEGPVAAIVRAFESEIGLWVSP